MLRLTEKEPVDTYMNAFTLFHTMDKDQEDSAQIVL